MFAVCPDAGRSARVVVAALPEMTESFAYEVVVAPIPTRSEVVASVTAPTLFVVQPPPVDAPPTETVPQTMFPFESVVRAWEPAQDVTGVRVSDEVKRPFVAES
jgi:hypothetical protein